MGFFFKLGRKNVPLPLIFLLEADCSHQAVAQRNDNNKGQNAAGHAARDEVRHFEVALARMRILHHNSSYKKRRLELAYALF